MLKKANVVLFRDYCLASFIFLICLAFIPLTGTTAAQAAQKPDAPKNDAARVDINSATQQDLQDIKGVGPALAQKIIAGRPYKSVDELSKAGISAKAAEAIKPFITVGKVQTVPPTAKAKVASPAAANKTPGAKININKADLETLQKLPGIGPGKASSIIAARPYKSIEDVMKVSDIKKQTFIGIKDLIAVE